MNSIAICPRVTYVLQLSYDPIKHENGELVYKLSSLYSFPAPHSSSSGFMTSLFFLLSPGLYNGASVAPSGFRSHPQHKVPSFTVSEPRLDNKTIVLSLKWSGMLKRRRLQDLLMTSPTMGHCALYHLSSFRPSEDDYVFTPTTRHHQGNASWHPFSRFFIFPTSGHSRQHCALASVLIRSLVALLRR